MVTKACKTGKVKAGKKLAPVEYIYLLQTRESRTDQLREADKLAIFKIGRTGQVNYSRFKTGYAKGYKLLLHMQCDDSKKTENELVHMFARRFEHVPDYGREYFYGSSRDMMLFIFMHIMTPAKPDESDLLTDIANLSIE